MLTHPRRRIVLTFAATAALSAAGLVAGVPGASAAIPAELLVSTQTPQLVYNINSVPSGGGAVSKAIGLATDPAISRDGTQLVFQQTLTTGSQWVLADASGHVSRRLFTTEPTSCTTPDWSPDGTKLLFSCGTVYSFGTYPALTTVDVATGVSKRILPQGRFFDTSARWSPRGDLIAFTRSGGPVAGPFGNTRSRVMLVRADGTGLVSLAAAATLSEHSPAFSPDGLSVAFVTRAFEPQDIPFTQEDLAVARVSDGATTRVSRPATAGANRYLFAPSYAPDGSTIAALETSNYQVYPVISKVALVPAAGGATTYAGSGATMNALSLTWRAARQTVAGTTASPAARVLPVATSQRLTAVPSGVADGAVAYARTNIGIEVAPSVGAAATTLTPTKNSLGLVAQPGSAGFTYDRTKPGDPTSYEIRNEPASGVGAVTIYTSPQRCAPRAWLTPTVLAVECYDYTALERTWGQLNTTTKTILVTSRLPLYATTGWQDTQPTWSRDGTRIAFTRSKADGSASRIMIMAANGTFIQPANPLAVTADSNDHSPAWTPQGDVVIATSRFATLDPVYHEDLALTRDTATGLFRLTSIGAVGNVRIFATTTVAPSNTRLLVNERTGVLGDGGGKSHPVVVSLTPAGLAGAATVPLFAQEVAPSTPSTGWAAG